jgi:hypothetical protein
LQPKIVEGGSLVDGGLKFDGDDDFMLMDSSVALGTEFYVPMVVTAVAADSENNSTFIGDSFHGGSDRLFLETTENALNYRNDNTNFYHPHLTQVEPRPS